MSVSKAMDLEKAELSPEGNIMTAEAIAATSTAPCSICLEDVVDRGGGRSIAKLQCGHEFHLDCVGSAFNAKGAMKCPNCRKTEKGRWLFANGHRCSSDFDIEGWMTEDIYDLVYSELPFALQWCTFRGFTQSESLFDDAEPQPNYYNELMGNSVFGEHSSASNSTHFCPYLALHGFPRAVHTVPSSSIDSIPENVPLHRHPTSFGGQSSTEVINSHSFPATEPQNQSWQRHHSHLFTLPGNSDQSSSHYGLSFPRNDTNNQQRLGSFIHPHLTMHRSIPQSGNNLVGSVGLPVIGDVRGHARGHNHQMYQQSPSLTPRSSHFPPISRIRPRGLTLVSSPPAEIGGFYGFSVSGSVNRNHQEGDSIGRHGRFYRWGREVNPLPWIPVEGESQWWSPFNPNQTPQPGSFTQRATGERVMQNRPENGYQRMPPPYM